MCHLQELYAKYKSKGLVILGFDASDDKKIALEMLHDNGATFPNIIDSSEVATKVCFQQYQGRYGSAVPMNYIIDREGKVVDAWYGGGKEHPKAIAALLKSGGDLGDAIRRETKAKVVKGAPEVAAAQRLFQAIRAADYDRDWLGSGDFKWFPAKDVRYLARDRENWVRWVCRTFKKNPITEVRLGQVFAGQRDMPTIHFELRLKDGRVLQGDLAFIWHPIWKQWVGWEGLDWHLHPPEQGSDTSSGSGWFGAALTFFFRSTQTAAPPARRDTGVARAKPRVIPNIPPLLGGWRVRSLWMRGEGDSQFDFPDGFAKKRPYNVIFTQKTFTLRLGNEVFAEMTYSIDGRQEPCAIDAKFADSRMLGICAGRDDELRISLNDAAKGRPNDFDQEHGGIVMTLYRYQGSALSVAKADGSDLKELIAMPDFTGTMSPDWSPDGCQIAWTAWRSLYGEILPDGAHSFVIHADGSGLKNLGRGNVPRWSPDGKKIVLSRLPDTPDEEHQSGLAHVILMNPDGSGAKDLGPGISPNWSPDGKRLVVSRPPESGDTSVRTFGVWVMNADGSGCQKIEELGTYPEWSPKRNEIAYIERLDNNPNLCVHDLATHRHRSLLEKQYLAFRLMRWSPDGKWICFRGELPDGNLELAAVHTEGEKKGLKLLWSSSTSADQNREFFSNATWNATSQEILARGRMPKDPILRVYLFALSGDKPPRPLLNHGTLPADALAYSPDGTRIACCGQRLSKPWASAGATPAKFGPLVELVLGPDSALDLDTGKVSVAPKTNRFQPRRDWMRGCGADVNVSDAFGGWTLRASDMVMKIVDDNRWDVSMEDLQDAIFVGTGTTPVEMAFRLTRQLPATYIFKTREGGVGVLQVVALSEAPKGMKIRYKLLAGGAAEKTSN